MFADEHLCRYEGRLYPDKEQGHLSRLHGLQNDLLVDPFWSDVVRRAVVVFAGVCESVQVLNPTRCALLSSDTWATVSRWLFSAEHVCALCSHAPRCHRSYRADLLASSPLREILRLAAHPFAHPNGIPVR